MTSAQATLITILAGIVSPLAIAILTFVNQRNANRAEKKADEVKSALEHTNKNVASSLSEIVTTGNNTHVLVNSQMGRQLLLSATALRALSNLQPEDQAMRVAADNAEAELKAHQRKQSALDDSMEGKVQ